MFFVSMSSPPRTVTFTKGSLFLINLTNCFEVMSSGAFQSAVASMNMLGPSVLSA